MKNIAILLFILFSSNSLFSQDTYSVGNENHELIMEVEGELDLLWNIIDNRYRYFVRKSDNTIVELLNTRNEARMYQWEYKSTLQNITGVPTFDLKFTLFDLKAYIDDYNLSQDPEYKTSIYKATPQLLFGTFGGVTNTPFVRNTTNAVLPQFGIELELLDGKRIKPHALFMQLRHVFKTHNFKFSTTELAMGYRFRVINATKFNLYAQSKFATLNFLKNTVADGAGGTTTVSETVFDIPFTFGVGAEISVSENSFFTISYNELFAALLENNGNFSTNITVGYKLTL
ncbi:hypothetical protein OE09_0339 [Flavobacteriaceae bacterium MAR_2010_72]|nr:hypothetical protein OE09_0339 [Flavobacteriaceae bacterium MAR_2010_72]TVZ57951.1 hypothetical protein NA63_0443 [Flavobacteriaceae bacterium MAR_2010_105]